MLSLLAPWFLAGLAAIGVPIFVHMIQKERKEIIQFPSLMFLQRIPYQSTRRQQIRHWPLLLLRILALLLLILAFTRPFFLQRAGLGGSSMNVGRDVVVLLDRSYSMEYGNRWQRATAAAKEAVEKLGSNDRAAVVYFGDNAVVASGLMGNKSAALKAIEAARPTASVTRYDVAFRAAQRVFGDTARPRREIILVSDYQRSGWGQRELPPLSAGTTLTQLNLSDTATANIFVTRTDIRYLDGAATDGRERVVVTARLANRGSRPVTKHAVKLEVNDRALQTKAIDIPANGMADVEFDGLPIPPGVSRGIVRSDTDSLQRDNAHYFVLARKQPMQVVLVESPQADSMAGLFLTRALGIGDRPSFDVKKIRSTQLSNDMLENASLVILSDVPVPGGTLGQQLVDYVKNGGGLLVALGNRSEPNKWPALAEQLMPRPSGAPIDRVAERGEAFGYIDRGHPVFEVFNGPRSGDFSNARFLRYWPVTAGDNDRQLARYGDSRPALLERRVGTGRVLVWTSDLDGLWNDITLQPIFLPFVRQAASYAAGFKDERLTAMVGQALSPAILFGDEAPLTDSVAAREAATKQQYVAIMPSGKQERFGTAGGPATLELAEQGFYELKRATGAAAENRLLAVNVDLSESDLTSLEPSLIETAVMPKGDAETQKAAVAAALPADVERRQSMWWYMLVIALILLGIETLWSNRLSRSAR